MDIKRVRTFVTVAEHGTRPRILYGQASQTGRPKSRNTHSRHHQPPGVFAATIPCHVRLRTQIVIAYRLCQ